MRRSVPQLSHAADVESVLKAVADETRLRDSFRQVDSQQITLSIDELHVDGRTATVRISRQDVIMSGGRRQTQSSRQTLRFEKSATGWIITAIGG